MVKINGAWDVVNFRSYVFTAANTSVSINLPPFGCFDSPANDVMVAGSVAMTGWALDDKRVVCVKIYLQPNNVFIGDACFVESVRPDVQQAYPNYPYSNRAGWGYVLLTRALPNGGNGIYTFTAVATDTNGATRTLGTKNLHCDNLNAKLPFGAIDTPAEGETATGKSFRIQGWVLTPQPNIIPTNGGTIEVLIDEKVVGHAIYNIYREDVARLFRGFKNSNGAFAYFDLDTTRYPNGLLSVAWRVSDSAGNMDGIGSRYFYIQNSTQSKMAAAEAPSLLITGPVGNELLRMAQPATITWTSVGLTHPVEISLYDDANLVGIIADNLAPAATSYTWTVGSLIDGTRVAQGTNYWIKVREKGTAVFDMVHNPFAIVLPSLKVLSNQHEEDLTIGSPRLISWRAAFVPNPLGISLYRNGTKIGEIAEPTLDPMEGSFIWDTGKLVDGTTVPVGSGYSFTVYENGGLGTTASSLSTFALTNAPYLSLVAPNGGEMLLLGGSKAVQWQALNISDTVELTLSLDDQELGPIATAVDAQSGLFIWQVGRLLDGSMVPAGSGYHLRVNLLNSSGRYDSYPLADTSVGTFTISEQSGLLLLYPSGGEEWTRNSVQRIVWSAGAGINGKLTLTLWRNGQQVGVIASDLAQQLSAYDWNVGRLNNGNWVDNASGYQIKVLDAGGQQLNANPGYLTIQVPLPSQIRLLSPNGGEEWAIGSTQTIYWNVTETPLTSLEIGLWGNGVLIGTIADSLDPSTGSYSWSVGRLKDGSLSEVGTNYQVKLAARDAGGRTYSVMSDAAFSLYDVYIPPQILVQAPAGGETWAEGTSHAIFWEAMGTFYDNLEITLWQNDAMVGVVADDLNATDGRFDWSVGLLKDGRWINPGPGYWIRIAERGSDGMVAGESPALFSIQLCGENWQTTPSSKKSWQSVCFGEGLFVAVSNLGGIATSPDGVTWTNRSLSTTGTIRAVAYGAQSGNFVAVGYSGLIITSPDGIAWTQRNAGISVNLRGISYGRGMFIAAGDSGRIYTSVNGGVSWVARSCSGVSDRLYACASGIANHVVVGASGVILSSPDGVTWTKCPSVTSNYIMGIVAGSNLFVATAQYGQILTSTDGLTWTPRTTGVTEHLYSAAYSPDDNFFTVAGYMGRILTSPDGVAWTIRSSSTTDHFWGLTYGNRTFVGVGADHLSYSTCQ